MRGGNVNFEYELLEDDAEPILLDVSANISDYDPGCMYLRNGDPGYPPEGGEVEDLEVTMPDGSVMNPIPAKLFSLLEELAHEAFVN